MSDLEESAHIVAQNIDVLLTHDGRQAVNKASEFSKSMSKLIEPLSLPENRTEDDWRALSWLLEQGTQTESRCIGTQTDENGVEHEVWQHTFTPLPSSPKQWGEADPFFDNPRINRVLARMGEQSVKQHKAEMRARKIKRRQRRAAQRRHNRGMR